MENKDGRGWQIVCMAQPLAPGFSWEQCNLAPLHRPVCPSTHLSGCAPLSLQHGGHHAGLLLLPPLPDQPAQPDLEELQARQRRGAGHLHVPDRYRRQHLLWWAGVGGPLAVRRCGPARAAWCARFCLQALHFVASFACSRPTSLHHALPSPAPAPGSSILIRSYTWDELRSSLPWLIGSLGTVALDAAIFVQWRTLGGGSGGAKDHPSDEESPLLDPGV